MLCCWPIRSFRAESHAAHTGPLSLSLSFLVSLSHHPSSPPRDHAPSGPLCGTGPVCPLRALPLSFSPPRNRPTVPLRPSASFLRPLRPQADSPGRLTELTVSTAGWLASWLAGFTGKASHPVGHLPSPACVPPVGRGLPGVTCQAVASVHSRHFEQPVRSPLGRARALDFKSLSFRACLSSSSLFALARARARTCNRVTLFFVFVFVIVFGLRLFLRSSTLFPSSFFGSSSSSSSCSSSFFVFHVRLPSRRLR